jgi:hypothetical protein
MMTKLQIRLPADVHAELVGRAKAAGRSLNQEMVSRLRASVDDAVRVAGPELLEVDHLFLSAFMRGGRQGAVARGHPEWTPREWLQDSMCFRLAVYMAVDALAKATPASSLPPEVTRTPRRRAVDELLPDARAARARLIQGHRPRGGALT